MKDCLKLVAKQDKQPDFETVAVSTYSHLSTQSESLYSALKHLTEEGTAARRVITSTPKEDGYAAWWSLNATFTQALAARQGAVMAQFTSTHSKPGKHPAETRSKLIEVDNAVKRWNEVMGDDVPEAMLRTAYVGILDPMSRTHLTNFQGKETKPEVLKQEILKFVSNAVVDHNAMQVGSIGSDGQVGDSHGVAYLAAEYEEPSEHWAWYEELSAISQKGGWYQPKGGYWDRIGKGKGKGQEKRSNM